MFWKETRSEVGKEKVKLEKWQRNHGQGRHLRKKVVKTPQKWWRKANKWKYKVGTCSPKASIKQPKDWRGRNA